MINRDSIPQTLINVVSASTMALLRWRFDKNNFSKYNSKSMLKSQDLKKSKLPDQPGVYLFKKGKVILYIGRATSIKDRVKSYFSRDLFETRGPLIVDLLFKANRIDYIKTSSVLEAIILEANLIKKHQPKYNTKEKDNKSFNYIVITKEYFPRVLIVRGREIEKGLPYIIKDKFGPYTNTELLKSALKILRKIVPFRDKCLPGFGKPCFNKQLGLCPGVCDGSINKMQYSKIINKIKLIFSGKINNLKLNLKREMDFYSGKREFEKANEIKKQIFSLEHIVDISLIKNFENKIENIELFRIEAYDVAHLAGTNNVGVMVVMERGELKKNDYRKFIIRNSKGDDIGALKEILNRRLKHTEWPRPDLLVLDGGIAQLNAAKGLIQSIPAVAVIKDDKHKAKAIIGDEKIINKSKKEILLINREAHRFAIAFHRQKRNVII